MHTYIKENKLWFGNADLPHEKWTHQIRPLDPRESIHLKLSHQLWGDMNGCYGYQL